MKKKFDLINNYSEILFTVLLLIEGFLQTSCYTFGNRIISFVLWPMIFIGMIPLLFNLLNYKEYLKDKKNILLLFFCFSFFVSSLLMYKYGIHDNIRIQIFLVLQLFVLYLYNKNIDIKTYENKMLIYLSVFLTGTLLLSTISLFHMITGYSKFVLQYDAPHIVYGFTWGRLFGAYWDPNIASVICCVSLAIIIHFFVKVKSWYLKLLWLLFGLIQLLYVVFSDSRTGRICLIVCVCSYVALYFYKYLFVDNKKKKTNQKMYIKAICAIATALILSISIPILIKDTYNKYVILSQKSSNNIDNNSNNKSSKNNESNIFSKKEQELDNTNNDTDINVNTLDRGYDLKDISNRRFDIWKSGLDIWKKNILFGVSRTNISKYAKEKMPNTYIVNNDQMTFTSMHNLYVDILVSQGLFGFIPFVVFLLLSLINILKNFNLILKKSNNVIMYLTIILTVGISTLVMTEIVYVDSPNSTLFWLSLGILNYLTLTVNISDKKSKNKKKLSVK